MASRKIEVQLVGDTSSLNRALGQAQSGLAKTGATMSRVGASMTRSLTLPIVAAGAAATKYTYEFDQSLNHISALVGANRHQMDYYRKSILALSPAVAQGPTQLADALYFVTSSGFKGAAAMRVLEASAKGAASGLGDTKTIADLVTSAVNVYGQKNLSAARAVDVLTQAVKDGKGEPADYATAMGRVIPIAQNLGVSFDQVGAALAALTLGGFSADKATTGLSSIFTNLSKPSASAKTALHDVGLSAAGIRKEITDKGLLPAMLDLNKAFDGNAVKLRQVFTSGKAIVPFLSLTGQAAQKNVGIFHDLANSTGASEQAFKKQSQTAAFTVQQSLAKIQVAAVQLGSVTLPVFADMASAVSGFTTELSTLSPGMQQVVIGAGIGLAALGPFVSVIGNVTTAFAGMRKAAIGAAGTEGLGGLAALLANPVFDLAALGVGVAALGTYAWVTSHQIDDLASSFSNAIGPISQFKGLIKSTTGAQHGFTAAQHEHEAAVHNTQAAQKSYNQTVAQYGKSSLQAKQALDRLNQSRDAEWQALIHQRDAHAKLRDTLDKQRAGYDKIVHSADRFTASSRHELGVLQQLEKVAQRRQVHGEASASSVAGMQRITALTKNYTDKTSALAVRLGEFAKRVDGTNPKLAALATKQAAAAIAAHDLSVKIDGIPTDHQIKVYYRQNMAGLTQEAKNLGSAIADIQSNKSINITTFYQAHGQPGSNAAGTPSWRGGATWVGEKGPELAFLPRGTRIVPHDQSMRMAGAGQAGGPITVNVAISKDEIAGIARVEVLEGNKRTARRVAVGSSWGA